MDLSGFMLLVATVALAVLFQKQADGDGGLGFS